MNAEAVVVPSPVCVFVLAPVEAIVVTLMELLHVGSADAPPLVRICPAVPVPGDCSAPVPVVPPQSTAYAVALERPVPPLSTVTVARVTANDPVPVPVTSPVSVIV